LEKKCHAWSYRRELIEASAEWHHAIVEKEEQEDGVNPKEGTKRNQYIVNCHVSSHRYRKRSIQWFPMDHDLIEERVLM
jgi:hypothetical protein